MPELEKTEEEVVVEENHLKLWNQYDDMTEVPEKWDYVESCPFG